MCFLNAMRLDACPMSRIVKIGNTPADVQEGLNAGAWVIGVTLSGNEVGLSLSQAAEMLTRRNGRPACALGGNTGSARRAHTT